MQASIVDTQKELASIELFAGAGGLAQGFAKAGFKPTVLVENDLQAQRLLEVNKRELGHTSQLPLLADVQNVDFREWEGRIDVITGGPPCQPFSLGGKRKGSEDPRDMFPQAIRAVREVRPRAFCFENVKGLLRADFIEYAEYIRLQLCYLDLTITPDETWGDHFSRLEQHHFAASSKEEYRVTVHAVNAADYGVPQLRERIFFVGVRCDERAKYSFPHPTHSCQALLHAQSSDGEYWRRHGLEPEVRLAAKKGRGLLTFSPRLPWLTTRDAICDLPTPTVDTSEVDGHIYIPGARSYNGHSGSDLDWPAKTLKAGSHGVPGGENSVRTPRDGLRYFTVRECARLQGFPDTYVFPLPWTRSMRYIGNAVPVELSRVIGNSFAQVLQ